MDSYGLYSLAPAAITILVTVTLKQVTLALFLGVAAGALVLGEFGISSFCHHLWECLLEAFSDAERVKIALFVIFIGGFLRVISFGGAYIKFARAIGTFLDSAKKTRIATWLLSLSLFFDDYANLLISGASMRPICQKNRVSPAMISYFVHIMAAFSSVMLISTWAAFESGLMFDAAAAIDIHKPATTLFMESIPFHFYTFFGIFLTFLVAYTGKWFAWKLDNQCLDEGDTSIKDNDKAQVKHVVIPIFSLVIMAIVSLFVFGYMAIRDDPGMEKNFVNIVGHAPTVNILFFSTIIVIGITVFMFLKDQVLPIQKIGSSLAKGMYGMMPVGLIIMFASGLSVVSRDLGTGIYIAGILKHFLSAPFLPAVIFVIAVIITIATGFCWSSMAIVMPIAFQLTASFGRLDLIPVISASVITGGCFGAQLIPYSDTSIMASIVCGISSVYHVKTQLPQILLVGAISIVAYILAGFGYSLIWIFILALAAIWIIYYLFTKNIPTS